MMDADPPFVKSFLEEEMAFGIRKRERIAWIVAAGGVATGLLGVAAVVLMLPLKQTEAYLAIVDKDTGVAERVVSVEKAGVDQAEGIKQSLLYSYVIDRETFDARDNEDRILKVYSRSEDGARRSLVALWAEGSENYPPKVYGASAKATVAITSITPITETTYQIRYTKTLARDADPERDRQILRHRHLPLCALAAKRHQPRLGKPDWLHRHRLPRDRRDVRGRPMILSPFSKTRVLAAAVAFAMLSPLPGFAETVPVPGNKDRRVTYATFQSRVRSMPSPQGCAPSR